MDSFLDYDFAEALGILSETLRDPASNIPVVLLALGVITAVFLIILVTVLLFVTAGGDEEEEDALGAEPQGLAAPSPDRVPFADTARVEPAVRRSLRGTLLFVVLATTLAWVGSGLLTQQPTVCTSCHVDHPHADVAEIDPHAGTRCVACHEPAGRIGSVTYMLPARAVHIAGGMLGNGWTRDYNQGISSIECARCHGAAISSTTTNETRGIRVSHVEPLEAGAECIDCHTLNTGVVSRLTVGMSACLRCHDGAQASSDCVSCHTKDIAVAARPSELASERRARDLIGQPDCGGCHDQTSCDACHGIRMPHSEDFLGLGHARAYAENRWLGDGQQCNKCHTATRRSCARCHAGVFPQHPLGIAESHKVADPSGQQCDACHNQPFIAGRNFCSDICHRPGQ